ncbi:hypothetical protein [Halosimplex amylolyticum]|uniref:hypothetical protein n=1 Tax=Halosimplex amylolyticum TaxID=3396616 RepID=UPI003F54646A
MERNRRDRFVWGLLGTLLVLSVIGAPLGAALCWKAFGHHRAMTGRVVADADRSGPSSTTVRQEPAEAETATDFPEGEP